MDDLSDEDLADSLRLITTIGDYAYIERFPNIARARAAREKSRLGTPEKVTQGSLGAAYDGTGLIHVAVDHELPSNLVDPLLSPRPWAMPWGHDVPVSLGVGGPRMDSPMTPEIVWSPDQRILPDRTAYPYRTALVMSPVPQPGEYYSGHCSAQSIYNHTASTAAHCLYDRLTQSYTGPYHLMTGVYTKENISGVTYEQSFVYGPIDCYDAYINSGYVTYGGADWDMAVLDFDGPINNGSPDALVGVRERPGGLAELSSCSWSRAGDAAGAR